MNCLYTHSIVIFVFIFLVASQFEKKTTLVSAWTVCHSNPYVIWLMGIIVSSLDKNVMLKLIEAEWHIHASVS